MDSRFRMETFGVGKVEVGRVFEIGRFGGGKTGEELIKGVECVHDFVTWRAEQFLILFYIVMCIKEVVMQMG